MSSSRPRICVVGSANVDLTFHTPRLPRPGETLAGRDFHLGFGGKGANQAVMAARLGAAVNMVAKVGKDAFGSQMIENLQREGIDTTFVLADETAPSGTAAIMVDDEAQNCIVVVPGANAALTPTDVRTAADALRNAHVLVCQLETRLETCLEALRVARAAGVHTLLNPAPAQKLPRELLDLVDVCVPNETEIELIAGKPVSTVVDARAAAADLGVRRLIVTLGSRGVLVIQDETETHIPARTVTAVDPTGAGDAFTGSFAVYWAQGLPLVEAARRANAVAALSVTRRGAQAGFPSYAEVEDFLRGG